ncbi:MAG: asparagine synthase (glutamine-hydrolyzing) [Rhizobiales bacterium 65-9]|nr:asparagine synthase (glutamine-hydrolyzing) [Hyphomicrobiales bacterium]OJY34332.1 MAG: asparagine synthase (glutamine-hydrolyzing) [Rhizobiales bacterium 65-9]
MCGIAGLFHRNGAPADRALAEAMADRLRHRGPDAGGAWSERSIALSHRRLAIRDLSPAGVQPFLSACGRVVVVYNGELYNDRKLAERLRREAGFTPRTTTDTEIIPAAYLAWGDDAVGELEGIFSFALWDRERERLLLARDHIGTKPLYIADIGPTLFFGSEIKAILPALAARPRLSPPDVAHMLALGYPAPTRATLLGMRQLAPGSFLIADREGVVEKSYWRPWRASDITDPEVARSAFIDEFKTVVSDQLISDVAVGSLQSGGIDSSLITMALPQERSIPLFSVRFPEASHDESSHVQALAAAAGREIRWIDMANDGAVADDFDACVLAADGQLADSSMLAAFRLCRLVRQHVAVALSGDGADEFFGGYPTYRATILAERYGPLAPRALASRLASAIKAVGGVSEKRIPKSELFYRFAYGFSQAAPHAAWRHYLADSERKALYGPALADELERDALALYASEYDAASGGPADKGLLADQSFYLPADMLVKLDRASMAHGLEVRVPFLDRRIMELAGRMSSPLFFGEDGKSTKLILRRALKALGAPSKIVSGAKRGFNVPVNLLLKGALRPLADRLLDRDADVFSPMLRSDGVRKIWRDHINGRRDEKYVVWTLLTLGRWIEKERLH